MAFVLPTDVATGDVLTASRYNQDVVENMERIGGAWTSFTPSWTGLTVGNATQTAAYLAAGKLYVVRVQITLGSTSSVAGAEMTLPDGASLSSGYSINHLVGSAGYLDSGAALHSGLVSPSSTVTRVRFLTQAVSGTAVVFDTVANIRPFTWATGDILAAQFVFERA